MGDDDQALIRQMLAQLHEVDVMLSAYEPQSSQQQLAARLQEFMDTLQRFKQHAASRTDPNIPVELLSFIDQGRHSDDYVRHLFEVAHADNQLVKGRVGALQALHTQLLQQAEGCFPGEVEAYRSVVEEKAAKSSAQEPAAGSGPAPPSPAAGQPG